MQKRQVQPFSIQEGRIMAHVALYIRVTENGQYRRNILLEQNKTIKLRHNEDYEISYFTELVAIIRVSKRGNAKVKNKTLSVTGYS